MATRKQPKHSAAPLLVELLTEELPPKALARLMEAFSHGLTEALREKHFLLPESAPQPYATPRRLAVVISHVLEKQADRLVERKGPAVVSALGADGQPAPALLGFAKSCGVDVSKLERQVGDKGDYFVYRAKQKGEPLKAHLAAVVEQVLKKLPVPKLMRWGDKDVQFVRPVHGIVLLHGNKLVPGTVLGLKSGNKTRGHRFLSKGTLTIARAADYAKVLKQAKVLVSFEERREAVARKLEETARRLKMKVFLPAEWVGTTAIADADDENEVIRILEAQPILRGNEDLVDEVTALVEWPTVYTGEFAREFLAVPAQCISLTMQKNQKYFVLMNAVAQIAPSFLFVSNQQAANPKQIIAGNERVLRARLSDARFFYEQDRKQKLEGRVARLANVVYHNKIGSQLERVERLVKLAGELARRLHADSAAAERGARLAKADLVTDMVGEFPELQGIMGRYYAQHDGEIPDVADAIAQHYWPRFAGDAVPTRVVAAAVALADRLDALCGMFGIGQPPTGDKDPFGLRRAALGVIRIVVEKNLPLQLNDLIDLAFSYLPSHLKPAHTDVEGFVFDRLSGYLRESGATVQEVEAVLARNPADLAEVPKILRAVQAFQKLPEAEALAAANKRIVNIIRKAGQEHQNADAARLVEAAELALFQALQKTRPAVEACVTARDYSGALQRLAALKQPVDAFFDQVMVMAEDPAVRDNRLALLGDLKLLMNRVADISRLAT